MSGVRAYLKAIEEEKQKSIFQKIFSIPGLFVTFIKINLIWAAYTVFSNM